METINLTIEHRGRNSTTFTGRPQGQSVRESLFLSNFDRDNVTRLVTIPCGTTSFNPSFYLGLFFDSISFLKGVDNFKKHYIIEILDGNLKIKKNLELNIAECERQARNEYVGKTGIDF